MLSTLRLLRQLLFCCFVDFLCFVPRNARTSINILTMYSVQGRTARFHENSHQSFLQNAPQYCQGNTRVTGCKARHAMRHMLSKGGGLCGRPLTTFVYKTNYMGGDTAYQAQDIPSSMSLLIVRQTFTTTHRTDTLYCCICARSVYASRSTCCMDVSMTQ